MATPELAKVLMHVLDSGKPMLKLNIWKILTICWVPEAVESLLFIESQLPLDQTVSPSDVIVKPKLV